MGEVVTIFIISQHVIELKGVGCFIKKVIQDKTFCVQKLFIKIYIFNLPSALSVQYIG